MKTTAARRGIQNTLRAIIGGFVLVSTAGASRPARCVLTVLVVRNSVNEWALAVSLQNVSGRRLSVREDALPWWGQHSSLLVAAEAQNGGPVLAQPWRIEDAETEVRTVVPGETLKGEIVLARRFPTLNETLKRRSVVIFWGFVLRTADGDEDSLQRGSVLIPNESGSVRE